MTPFPVALFPAAGAAVKAGGFVGAVLIGIALYAAYQATKQAQPQPQQRR